MDKFTLQPYRQLAKVLRETGDERGARRVLFEMEHRRRKEQDRKWYWRCWDWVLKWTIGYGQMSARALAWLLLLAVTGSVLSGFGYLGGAMVPNNKEAYDSFDKHAYLPSNYPEFNPFIYSLEQSFPLANLGMRDHWEPNPVGSVAAPALRCSMLRAMRDRTVRGYHLFRLNAPGFLRWWFWCQTLAGWVLATLFVAGLTGIVKSGP